MRVALQCALSDSNLDTTHVNSQRQLAISIAAIAGAERHAPLNLCLILDHSGSMSGRPLDTVKQAAIEIMEQLSPGDRLAVVTFNHRAAVLIPNDLVTDQADLKAKITKLAANGGTCIDEGMKLGIEELLKGTKDTISQVFLLTDGENEHGSNDRCLKLAALAATHNITLNTLGFGDRWNQDVLESIADAAGGSLTYIAQPEDAIAEFSKLFSRIQSVALTNAHLLLDLGEVSRLAELKPIAQVAPDTVELAVNQEDHRLIVRLGDLMVDAPRVILVNLYISQLTAGTHSLAQVQVRYDDPGSNQTAIASEPVVVTITALPAATPATDPGVKNHVLALAKYRQTQIAEQKLKDGDRVAAATMLQSAAKTALQMGDQGAATVLQANATRLQAGQDLSDADRKRTRIASKTMLQAPKPNEPS